MKTFFLKTRNIESSTITNILKEFNLESATSSQDKIDYIIIDHEEDLRLVAEEFEVLRRNIKIVSLVKLKNFEGFLGLNGALILDIEKANDYSYKKILKNFFEERVSLHLEDNLINVFNEFHQFDLTSYLTVGQMTDELLAYTLSRNFDPIAPRIFVDHVVYFLSHLRQAGLAFVPFEFEAGLSDEKFAIQATVPVKNFSADYIHKSFGNMASGHSLNTLLSIALNSCDNMHISYLEEQSKLQFLGVWKQGTTERQGLLSIQNLKTSKQIFHEVEEKVYAYKTFELENTLKEDHRLPGTLFEILEKESQVIVELGLEDFVDLCCDKFKKEEFSPKAFEEFISEYEKDQLGRSLSKSEKDAVLKVVENILKDQEILEDVKTLRATISSNEEEIRTFQNILDEEIVEKVTGLLEKHGNILVKGHKEKPDNFVKRLKASQKLEDFVLHIGGKLTDRETPFDFDKMRADKKSQIIKGMWKGVILEASQKYELKADETQGFEEKTSNLLEQKLKEYLVNKNKTLEELNSADFDFFNRSIAKKSIQKSIENIDIKNIENDFQFALASGLAEMEGEDKKEAVQRVLKEQFRLHELDPNAISHLKVQLSSFLSDLFPNNTQEAASAAQEITEKLRKKELENVLENLFKEQKKVEKSLLLIDRSQTDLLLEKERVVSLSESVLLKKLKLAQEENQKLMKQMNQGLDENLVKEVEKLNVALSNKDIIIQKAKTSMRDLVSKKELEIQKLNKKLEEILEKEEVKTSHDAIMDLEIKNKNLEKKVEIYKNKVMALSEVKKEAQPLNTATSKNLVRAKEVTENALQFEKKKSSSLEDKLVQSRELEGKLRAEILSLMQENKEHKKVIKELNVPKEELASTSNRVIDNQNKLKNENSMLVAKVKELEDKLKNMVAQAVAHQANSNTVSAKEKQLESQAKKLNQELLKSHSQIAEEKKSSIKMRAENTALKNQIVKLEKELNRIVAEQSAKKAA